MDDTLKAALARIPALQNVDAPDVTRLGGLTNLVYLVKGAGDDYVLRLPGEGTEDYIDRDVEAFNADAAATAGVSPKVVFCAPDEGLMLTEYLDNTETMTPELFASRPGSPGRAAKALRQLHTSGREFQFRFELFSMIDDYLGLLDKKGAELPDGYHDVVDAARPVRETLDAHPLALAPCHCDPLCENFLDTGERMWIVDWEYSGMNDPIWDLGDLSVEAGFTDAQDREMMSAYCGGGVPEALFGRMIIYKAMCDLLWTLWGLIQHADDNPAEDFWAYSAGRFERCKALMGHQDFPGYLSSINNG